VLDVPIEPAEVAEILSGVEQLPRDVESLFGEGDSAARFRAIIAEEAFLAITGAEIFCRSSVG
jgi:hypothetical protein